MTGTTVGTIYVGEEVHNGDGTITRHVRVENPLKSSSTLYISYIYMYFPDSAFKMGDNASVTVSDVYYIGYDSEERNQVLVSGNSSKVVKYNFLDYKNNQFTLQAINRTSNATTGMTNVYNWNVNRTRDNLIKTASLINSAYIINNAAADTEDAKTVKCSYNTTDQQVNISIITMPVGLDDKGDLKTSLTVKWTGIDEDGNIKSGQLECDKIRTAGISTYERGYVIIKAEELGIVSFKSAETDMGRIPGNYRSSSWTANNEYNQNPCGAYGYFTDQTVGNRIKSTFEISNTDSEAEPYDLSCESMADSSGEPRCYFQNRLAPKVSKVVAGNPIEFADKTSPINITSYVCAGNIEKRGSNCSMIANPVIILKLPKGMTYSGLAFKKRVTQYYGYDDTATNVYYVPLDYTIENISYRNTTDDGVSIYRIIFKDRNLVIGYMDQDGNYSNLYMSGTLNTDKTMTTQTYDLNDIINVTAENNLSAANYTSDGYSMAVEDTYNINGGNPMASGRIDNASIRGISVQRLSAIMVQNELAISKVNSVPLEDKNIIWNTYDESNPNSTSFFGLNSEGKYKIQISNPSSSEAEGFKMVVPIPKKGENLGTMFQSQENEFDMTLSGVDIPEAYHYKYIKVNPLPNEANMSSLSYEEADGNTANAILITRDIIPSHAIDELVFNFVIDEEGNPEITGGERDIWRNYFSYTLDGKVNEVRGSYVAAEVAKGAISGTVFSDNNDNGILDGEDEAGIGGITVNVKDSSGRLQTTTTDENGRYFFNQLREDSIELTMTAQDGSTYRFNKEPIAYIPGGVTGNMVSPGSDRKSATASLSSVAENSVVNASVSKICTITYDKGNGSGEPPSASEYFTGKLAKVIAAPSGMYKTGYDFIGWSKASKDAKEPDYQPGDTFEIEEDVTLYALWKARTVKITFDYKGGRTTSSGYDYKYVTYDQLFREKDINNKTWPANPSMGTPEEGWQFWKWERPTSPILGYGAGVWSSNKSNIEEDTTVRAVYSRLSSQNGQLSVKYGQESTEDSPLYDFSKVINVENDAQPTTSNRITYSSTDVLPKGMTFSEDYSKIYGKPQEVTKDPVEITMKVKARNNLTFTYKLKIQVRPADLTIKAATAPAAGTKLDVFTNSADVTLTADVTGRIDTDDINEGNQIVFYGQKYGEGKFKIGTGSLDADGKATCSWHVDKNIDENITGTYRITAQIENIYDRYTVENNSSVTGFVISDAPIITHTLHFDGNGQGVTAPTDKTVIEGKKYGTMPTPLRPGYRFDGWFTESETGEEVKALDVVNLGMTSVEKTLYAHWTGKEYSVYYDINGGISEDLTRKDVGYYSSLLLPDTEVKRTGYLFSGWKLKGTDTTVTKDTVYNSLVDNDSVVSVTLEAQWTPVSYKVTYNANGGSVAGFGFRVSYNSPYGSIQTPSRNGYDFAGWLDQDNKKVTEETVYRFDSDSELTAQWTPKTGYKVVYNSLGGESVETKTGVAWTDTGLNSPETSRYGYEFQGWKCGASDIKDTTYYASLAVADNVLSVILEAQWKPVESTVSFESNYPSNDSDFIGYKGEKSKKAVYDDFYGELPVPSYKGYEFDGWYTKADGGTKVIAVTRVSAAENHKLYGHWKEKKYKVSYDLNGGTSNPLEDKEVSFISADLLPDEEVTRTGYVLKGWKVKGTDMEVTGDSSYRSVVEDDSVSSVVLEAEWTPKNDYSIEYNTKGGSKIDNRTGVLWTDTALNAPRLEKYGYRFKGWKCRDVAVTDEMPYSSLVKDDTVSSITMEAQWEAVKTRVSFESNYPSENPGFSGFEGDSTKDVYYDEIYGELPGASYKGYEFEGWYTEAEGGTKVTPETKVSFVDNHKLYGHWRVKKYTVVYDIKGGALAGAESKEVSYIDSALIPEGEATRTGYIFNGWVLKDTDQTVTSDTVYNSLVRDDSVSSAILEARWTPAEYKVSYDANGGIVEGFELRVSYDSPYGPLLTPGRNGYVFNSWLDKNNDKVTENTIYKFAGDSELTAQWTPKTGYKVIYNTNGGDPVEVKTGVNWTDTGLNSPESERYGYEFKGWKCGTRDITDTTTYASLAASDNVLSVILEAQWEPVKSTVSFSRNYPVKNPSIDSDKIETSNVSYGSLYGKLPAEAFTGYSFLGWYTKAEGGTKVTADTRVTEVENHELYGHWKINEYKVSLPEGQSSYKVTAAGDKNTVKHGDSYSFKVELSEGYSRTDQYSVRIKEAGAPDNSAEELKESGDGYYTIPKVTHPVIVMVSGIEDITPPQAIIKSEANSWNKLLNKISFGIFFNKTEKIELTSEDAGSGVKLTEYYVSDRALSEAELNKIENSKWIVISQGEKGFFNQSPESKAVVYVYTEDNNGNGAFYSSDGMIFTKEKPLITGADNNERRVVDSDVIVNVSDPYLEEVRLYTGENDKADVIKGSQVILPKPEEGEITYTIYGRNKSGNESTCKVTLVKATYDIKVENLELNDEEYGYADPESQPVNIRSEGNSDTTITKVALGGKDSQSFELNKSQGTMIPKGSTDTSYTVRPKAYLDAGEYSARVVVTYNDGKTQEGDLFFRVNRKEAELKWGNTSFVYAGSKPQVSAVVSNLLPGDMCNVTVKMDENNIPGTYEDKAVATDLSNGNYRLPDSNKASYSIDKGTMTGISVMPYENMADGGYHDGVTGIQGIKDSDKVEYYTSEDGQSWLRWDGPERVPQVKNCGKTMIKAVINRNYYYPYEEVVTSFVKAKPVVVIKPPVYHSEDATRVTVAGEVTAGDYPVKQLNFRYRKTGDKDWITIDSIGTSVDLNGLMEDTIYELELSAVDDCGNAAHDYQQFQTNPKPQCTGESEVTGEAEESTNISVTLERGNTIVSSITGLNKKDTFSFINIPDGEYNLVTTDGTYRTTRMATVKNSKTDNLMVNPVGSKETRVEVKGNAPDIAGDGLNELFDTDLYLNNSEAEEEIKNGGSTEIRLTAEETEDEEVKKTMGVKAEAGQRVVGLYTDLAGQLTVTPKGGYSTVTELSEAPKMVLVAIPLPEDIQGKDSYRILRNIDGSTEEMPVLTGDNIGNPKNEGYYVDEAYAYVWTKSFATYGIAVGDKVDNLEKPSTGEIQFSPDPSSMENLNEQRNNIIDNLPEELTTDERQEIISDLNKIYNDGIDRIVNSSGEEEVTAAVKDTEDCLNEKLDEARQYVGEVLPENLKHNSLWWLLILLILMIGYIVYKYKKERKQ